MYVAHVSQHVSNLATQNSLAKPMPKFGSFLVWDLGASNPKTGMVKGKLHADDGSLIQDLSGRPVAPNGVANPAEFVKELGERSKEVLEGVKEKIKADPLKQIVIFMPGQMKGTLNRFIENVLTHEGKSLYDVEFGPLGKQLNAYAKPGEAVEVKVANDMVGSAAATIQAIQSHPELKERFKQDGFKVYLAMVGGGLGNIEIQRHGDNVVLNATEGGHLAPLHRVSNDSTAVVESETISSRAMIRNVATKLQLPVDAITSTGSMRLPVGEVETLDAKHPALVALEKSGRFKITPKNDTQVEVVLSDNPTKVRKAALEGIRDMLKGLAQVSQIEALKGTNAVILIGPVLNWANRYLKEDVTLTREVFGTRGDVNLPRLLRKEVNRISTPVLDGTAENAGFKFYVDVPVSNNAEGGVIFRNAKPVGPWEYRYRLPAPSDSAPSRSAV